jgi:hypothetical protein
VAVDCDEEDSNQKNNEKENRAEPATALSDHAGWAGSRPEPGDALPDRLQKIRL